MIEVKNIVKKYKLKVGSATALDGVSFSLPDKGLVFILGKSGSGKSTLLNVLGTLDSYDSGDIIIEGKSTKDFNSSDYSNYRNEYIGFVFQEFNLLKDLSVKDNLALALELQNHKAESDLIAEILEKVDLKGYEYRRINELSGGQKQRVAIARALIKKPKMLLCDEPTGSLDSKTAQGIFELLKKLSRDCLVVIVSHDRDSAALYGDRIIKIRDGKIESDTANVQPTEEKTSEFSLQKYSLPLKSKLKLAAINLKKRPVRLIIAMLIAVISVGLFGFAGAIANHDKNEVIAESMMNNGLKYFSYSKKFISIDNDGDGYINETKFDDNDIKVLAARSGIETAKIDVIYGFYQNKINNFKISNEIYRAEVTAPSGFVEVTDDFLKRYDIQMIAGRLPVNDDEVVITKYYYDLFKRKGYQRFETIVTVNDFEDLAGHIIYLSTPHFDDGKDLKIVGIVDTHLNEDLYNEITLSDETDLLMIYSFNEMMKSSLHNAVFLSQGYYARNFKEKLDSEIQAPKDSYSKKPLTLEGDNSINVKSSKLAKFDESDSHYCFFNKDQTRLQDDEVIVTIESLNKLPNLNSSLDETASAFAEQSFNAEPEKFLKDNPGWSWNDYYSYLKDNNYCDERYMHVDRSYFSFPIIREIAKDWDYEFSDVTLKRNIFDERYPKSEKLKLAGISDDVGEAITLSAAKFAQVKFELSPYLNPYSGLVVPIFDSLSMNARLVEIGDEDFVESTPLYSGNYKYKNSQYELRNECVDSYNDIKYTLEPFQDVFKYIAVVLIIFTIFFIYLYFSGVIADKKKDIGILRAMGTKKRDIIGIFAIENVLISTIIIGLAVSLDLLAVSLANAYFIKNMNAMLTIISYSIVHVLLIAVLTLGSVFLGSLIPVVHVMRKKPAAIITKSK